MISWYLIRYLVVRFNVHTQYLAAIPASSDYEGRRTDRRRQQEHHKYPPVASSHAVAHERAMMVQTNHTPIAVLSNTWAIISER